MIINMTGGGGSGGTLVVTAPVGVTVTATKGNKTYTRIVNAEGKATFRGLSSGTWMLSIDDATHEPSTPVPVEIRADYTVTLNFFAATINVTYPAGSTCTCTDGNITLTASDTSGSYTFTVPNAGTWTVSSTNGSQSDSKTVSITTDGQSESVTLAYFSATINVTYPATSTCVVTDSGGATVASDSNTGSSAKTWTATVTATGTYTVTATATDGSGKTKSGNVSITSNGQSASVTLKYITYLYDTGNECNSITGGWTSVGIQALTTNARTAPVLSKGASSMTATLGKQGDTGNSGVVRPNNPINLTNAKTLIFNLSASTGSQWNWGNIVVYSTSTTVLGDHCDNAAATKMFSGYEKIDFPVANYTLDVSALSGDFYVGVFLYNAASSAQMEFVINSIGME